MTWKPLRQVTKRSNRDALEAMEFMSFDLNKRGCCSFAFINVQRQPFGVCLVLTVCLGQLGIA